MANGFDDEGAWGSASRIPTDTWFPVNTAMGAWDLPGQPPTIASSVGMPAVPAPPALGGLPDQAPLAIGQVAGGFAPPLGAQPRLQRAARAADLGMLPAQPSIWENIARGIGMASPQGRQILQGYDQQAQQKLQNRLVERRQALAEEQDARASTRERFQTFVKLADVKNKALRNMYFDRLVADMQANGETLPVDVIETFKKTGLDEGKHMAQLLAPLFTSAGIDPMVGAQLLEEGRDPKDVLSVLELAQKQKKLELEQQEISGLDASRQRAFGTLGGDSGVTASAQTPTPAPAEPPLANVGMRTTDGARAPMPIRMNNPLNIKQGAATQKWIDQGVAQPGDPAQDGGRFLKFQSPQQGVQAAQDLLTGPTYSGLTVDAALKKWSNNGYGGEIVTGVDSSKKIADLTPGELTRTMGAMMQREGGGTGGGTATRPAGGTTQDQAQLQAIDRRLAAMDQELAAVVGRGGERTRAYVDDVRAMRDKLQTQRDRLEDRLTETPRAVAKERELQPLKKELAEAGKALTPIDRMTQQSLATNKSVYRSIGKIEEYLREGTDLPADFVNLVAQDAPGISAWLQSDPKNITGLAKQWETKFKAVAENDPRANRFLAALGNMRDLVIRERSGGSVTGNELDRAMGAFMGSLPNINQAFSLFAQNLANVKETVMDELVTAGAASRPLSGGKAMYGTLPKEIRDRIDYAERGEDYPKAQMPAKRPQVTGPITQVSP